MCQGECARPSQHRGLHDDLGVLDVLPALHHPQLQLSRAGLLSFSCFGCRAQGRSEQVGWNLIHPSSSHSSEVLLQEGLHTAPCCLPSNRQQGAELPHPSCPPPDRGHLQGRQSTDGYLLHTGWSSAGRAAWQTPFSHRPPVERTETQVTHLLSISVENTSSSTSSLSHQGAGLTVPHTHTGHGWDPTGLTAGQPSTEMLLH